MNKLELELCQCMAVLRNNFHGIDEVLARRDGADFMCRMELIQKAAESAQSIWASIRRTA